MPEQTTETVVYEPPMLQEVGDFQELTLGKGGGGFDSYWECLYFCDR